MLLLPEEDDGGALACGGVVRVEEDVDEEEDDDMPLGLFADNDVPELLDSDTVLSPSSLSSELLRDGSMSGQSAGGASGIVISSHDGDDDDPREPMLSLLCVRLPTLLDRLELCADDATDEERCVRPASPGAGTRRALAPIAAAAVLPLCSLSSSSSSSSSSSGWGVDERTERIGTASLGGGGVVGEAATAAAAALAARSALRLMDEGSLSCVGNATGSKEEATGEPTSLRVKPRSSTLRRTPK